MTELAAWGPTLVSIASALIFLGVVYGKHEGNTRRIEEHDAHIEKLQGRMNEADVAIAKLESWRDGYNAAVAKHER